MEYGAISLCLLGLAVAGTIKGATGIGFTTAALPFLTLAAGHRSAMVLVLASAVASNFALMLKAGDLTSVGRRFAPLYIAMVPGILLGAGALSLVNPRTAALGMAFTTLAYVGLSVCRPDLRMSRSAGRVLAAPAGFLNGVMTGLTGSQIMPLMPYMMSLGLRPNEQVQAVNIAVMLASLLVGVALVTGGLASTNELVVSVLGIPFALMGVSIGSHAREQMTADGFKKITLLVLALTAAIVIARALL